MNKFSLEKHPKIKSGFTAPENYFHNLPMEILAKTKIEQPKKGKVFTLKNLGYAAAAVLVLALSISFLISKSTISFEEVDTATLENYITYQSNVSQFELLNLMDSYQIESMQIQLNLEDESIENILTTNSNFELYLID